MTVSRAVPAPLSDPPSGHGGIGVAIRNTVPGRPGLRHNRQSIKHGFTRHMEKMMGLFRDSSEEKQLRDAANDVAQIVGRVAEGTFPMDYLTEVWPSYQQRVQASYDAVAAKHGGKAPIKILRAAYDIAAIWAGEGPGCARRARQLLESVW